jgi:HPr Serine kinase C-terminal domain
MPALPDVAAAPADEGAAHYTGFGLRLEVDARIDASGLGLAPGAHSRDRLLTRVRLDPQGLERRWEAVGAGAVRTRELREGGAVVLSVDLAEPAGYLLWAEGVGRALVSADGGEVLCDPLPGRPDWAFILPAQVLPLAATLNGLEVLHAAGLVHGGEGVLLAGEPGAGKSSLAAALMRRGAALLSDDCIALERRDRGLLAHPGAGLLYLRSAEHDRLGADERAGLGPPTPFAGKQRYDPGAVVEPAPFGALLLLERATAGPALERIEEVDPFALLAATFNLSVRTPERLTRQLDLVAAIASSGRVHRVRVLPGTDATQLAEGIERYLTEVGT